VTESPYISRGGEIKNPDGLLGSACKFGYQSHYTLGSPFSFFFFLFIILFDYFVFFLFLFKKNCSGQEKV